MFSFSSEPLYCVPFRVELSRNGTLYAGDASLRDIWCTWRGRPCAGTRRDIYGVLTQAGQGGCAHGIGALPRRWKEDQRDSVFSILEVVWSGTKVAILEVDLGMIENWWKLMRCTKLGGSKVFLQRRWPILRQGFITFNVFMLFRYHSFTFHSRDCVMLCVGIFRFPIRSNAFPWTHCGCRCIVVSVSKSRLCRSQPASMRGWSSLKKDLGITWTCISIWVEELFEAVSENAQVQFTWLPCLMAFCLWLVPLCSTASQLVSQGHH